MLWLRGPSGDARRRWLSRAFSSTHNEHDHGVLAWGSGAQGALGIRNTRDQYEPEHMQHDLLPPDVAAVGAGHFTSFAVTSGGHLWSWGRAREGQLGRPLRHDEAELSAAPAPVQGLAGQKVVAATGSGVASFALTASGTVWSWGSSSCGQLGLGRQRQKAPAPQRVKGVPESVVQLAAGWGHAAALTGRSDETGKEGDVYTWGWPADGRLGHSFAATGHAEEDGAQAPEQRCVWQPQRVELLRTVKVQQIACGGDHTMALAQDGTLFTFGSNSLAQLGRPSPRGGEHQQPRDAGAWLVNPEASCGSGMRFLRVAAGLAHCLAVAQDGSVLSWGWNSSGQLGLGQFVTDQVIKRPTPIYGIPNNRYARIAAGRLHSVLVTDDVLRNPSSVLLKRTVVHTMCYRCVAAPAAAPAAALPGRTAVGTSNWGSATNGRLGTGMFEDAYYPELLPDVDGDVLEAVAAGLDHTLLLVRL
ncbi:hypothetical protein N2152v2_002736 [Parachlorella kessleri]